MSVVKSVNIFLEDSEVGGVPLIIWWIRKLLPRRKKRRETVIRWLTFVMTFVTYAFYNMSRRPMSVVKSQIISECIATKDLPESSRKLWCRNYNIGMTTEERMGLLDSLYIAVYALCLYGSGIIADCYNPRYYLASGCVLSGFCCAVMGLSDLWNIQSYKYLATAQILFGAAQSTGWPVVLSCITHWYSGERRGLFFGFWNNHHYMGSILGIYLAGLYVETQWGWSFFLPAFIISLWGFVILLLLVTDPIDLSGLDVDKNAPPIGLGGDLEVPPWLDSKRSIKFSDALRLPGVMEYSACMFFSRIVGYIYLYWLPAQISQTAGIGASQAAYYSIGYVVGACLGGIIAGIFVDLFRRSALTCAVFLLISIPVIFVNSIVKIGSNLSADIPLTLFLGLLVEGPYVVISTSVSADLGTHKLIKRDHRAISTMGGIIEGTGALGAVFGPILSGYFFTRHQWSHVIYLMMGIQFTAVLCLSRLAYRDFFRKQKTRDFAEYLRAPSIF